MKKYEFTLIELLVVIAIIAILAAMLLPVLGQARDRGHQVTCMNQLRTLNSAFISYMDSFDFIPPHKVPNGLPGKSTATWYNILEYVRLWHYENSSYTKRINQCPKEENKQAVDYGMNAVYYYAFRHPSKLRKPSRMILAGDWINHNSVFGFKKLSNPEGALPAFRHGTGGGSTNMSFFDGHGASINMSAFPATTDTELLWQ